MHAPPSVALLIETSNAYARGLLAGIVAYMSEHQQWSIYLPELGRGDRPPHWLNRWQGDGLIARIENEEIAAIVRTLRVPVVDVSAGRRLPNAPYVETDDRAIASLAAEHLIERGFRHLAYCGDPQFTWSLQRERYFVEAVQRAGLQCDVFRLKSRGSEPADWAAERRHLAHWLERLPRPVGVMACYDIMAQRVLDLCRELNIAVPEQLALVGVDNDELLCNLCWPPLSSVIPDTLRTGKEAARLLDRLMGGESVGDLAILVEPLGIATRHSTDVLAIEDQEIADAVKFIRDFACEGIQVEDVLRHVPLSRRVLESRFRKIMGRTPHEEILRQRIERVSRLLTETDLSLDKIAHRTGFRHQEYMSVAFRRAQKIPPGQYRRQHKS